MTFLDKLQDFLGLTPDPPIKYKVTITEAPPSSDETIAQALENLKMRVKKTQAAERAAKAAKEAAEKVTSWRKGVPQRLKPHCKQGSCGTGKPVPLSKTDFSPQLVCPRVPRPPPPRSGLGCNVAGLRPWLSDRFLAFRLAPNTG